MPSFVRTLIPLVELILHLNILLRCHLWKVTERICPHPLLPRDKHLFAELHLFKVNFGKKEFHFSFIRINRLHACQFDIQPSANVQVSFELEFEFWVCCFFQLLDGISFSPCCSSWLLCCQLVKRKLTFDSHSRTQFDRRIFRLFKLHCVFSFLSSLWQSLSFAWQEETYTLTKFRCNSKRTKARRKQKKESILSPVFYLLPVTRGHFYCANFLSPPPKSAVNEGKE